jgi:hypothetical protein
MPAACFSDEELVELEALLRLAAAIKEEEEREEQEAAGALANGTSPWAFRSNPTLCRWSPQIQALADAVRGAELTLASMRARGDQAGADMIGRELHVATAALAAAKREPETGVAEFAKSVCLDDDEPAPGARFCRVCFAPLSNGASFCSDRCRGTHQRLLPVPHAEEHNRLIGYRRWPPVGRPKRRDPSHRNCGGSY